MIKAVLFDLDGTLLRMDNHLFIKAYFKSILMYMAKYGYKPEELKNAMFKGVGRIINNDGKLTNEEVFFDSFIKEIDLKDTKEELLELFDKYYQSEFNELGKGVVYDKDIKKIFDLLKDKGIKIILATAPVFPLIAIKARLNWAYLDSDDFSYITSYENARYCKPNPKYYKEILDVLALSNEEVLMVGNDVNDDIKPCEAMNINTYLIDGYTLNDDGYDGKRGSFNDLYQYLSEVL